MKLNIKWASIEVENQEHALEIVEKLEAVLKTDSEHFRWDYEIEES